MNESTSKNIISLVTVVLNHVNHIETTIRSVLSQVDCVIEYIVIDGGSTDGTLDVIEKYRDRIQYFIKGIADWDVTGLTIFCILGLQPYNTILQINLTPGQI